MTKSKEILQKEEKYNRGKMTMLQFRQIATLADNLSKFDEAIKWMEYPDFTKTEKEAEDYISNLCEELDGESEKEYDPSDAGARSEERYKELNDGH